MHLKILTGGNITLAVAKTFHFLICKVAITVVEKSQRLKINSINSTYQFEYKIFYIIFVNESSKLLYSRDAERMREKQLKKQQDEGMKPVAT